MLPKLHPNAPLFAVNRSSHDFKPAQGPSMAQPLLALPSFLPEGRQVELLLSSAHLLIYIPSHVAIPDKSYAQLDEVNDTDRRSGHIHDMDQNVVRDSGMVTMQFW